jgi:hypothetical protein
VLAAAFLYSSVHFCVCLYRRARDIHTTLTHTKSTTISAASERDEKGVHQKTLKQHDVKPIFKISFPREPPSVFFHSRTLQRVYLFLLINDVHCRYLIDHIQQQSNNISSRNVYLGQKNMLLILPCGNISSGAILAAQNAQIM